ncbi:MAG: hypothetical protein RL701_1888 [Pseudomonadota bacterium]|jgi:competence protein ComEA
MLGNTQTLRFAGWLACVVGIVMCSSPASAEAGTMMRPAVPEASKSSVEPPPGVVNLNSASADELERLPGVGPTRARAILELRARLKQFSRIEQLMRVKGIGRATFRKLRPWLTLTGPTTLQNRASARSG